MKSKLKKYKGKSTRKRIIIVYTHKYYATRLPTQAVYSFFLQSKLFRTNFFLNRTCNLYVYKTDLINIEKFTQLTIPLCLAQLYDWLIVRSVIISIILLTEKYKVLHMVVLSAQRLFKCVCVFFFCEALDYIYFTNSL